MIGALMSATGAGFGPLPEEELASFARDRFDALIEGKDEITVDWHSALYTLKEARVEAQADESDLSEPSGFEESYKQEFDVRVFSTDKGLDVHEMATELNTLGAEGWATSHVLENQLLADGTHGHIFIFQRYVARTTEPEGSAETEHPTTEQGA